MLQWSCAAYVVHHCRKQLHWDSLPGYVCVAALKIWQAKTHKACPYNHTAAAVCGGVAGAAAAAFSWTNTRGRHLITDTMGSLLDYDHRDPQQNNVFFYNEVVYGLPLFHGEWSNVSLCFSVYCSFKFDMSCFTVLHIESLKVKSKVTGEKKQHLDHLLKHSNSYKNILPEILIKLHLITFINIKLKHQHIIHFKSKGQ